METWEKTLKKRFLSKTTKIKNGCWIWNGSKMGNYGAIGTKRGMSNLYAHRAAYLIFKGKIPEALLVCHSCDNVLCVNPDHLFLGSQKDNMRDMRKKGRGTKGKNHPNAILNIIICRKIRKEYAKGNTSLSKIGKKYGITFQHVHDIVKFRIWKE